MAERKCESCGYSLPDNAKYCPACGKQHENKKQYCIHCGQIIEYFSDGSSIICPNCGEVNDIIFPIDKKDDAPSDLKQDSKAIPSETISVSEPTSSSIWKCLYCGAENSSDDEYCKKCSTSKHFNQPLPDTPNNDKEQTWICLYCGTSNSENDEYCKECGTSKEGNIWKCLSCRNTNSISLSQCYKCNRQHNKANNDDRYGPNENNNVHSDWVCLNCGTTNSKNYEFCKVCSFSKNNKTWKCPSCGTINALIYDKCRVCNKKNNYINNSTFSQQEIQQAQNNTLHRNTSLTYNANDNLNTHKPVPYTLIVCIWLYLIYWGPIRYGILSHQAQEVYVGIIVSWIIFLLCRKKLNAFWTNLWTIIALFIGMFPVFPLIGLMYIYGLLTGSIK